MYFGRVIITTYILVSIFFFTQRFVFQGFSFTGNFHTTHRSVCHCSGTIFYKMLFKKKKKDIYLLTGNKRKGRKRKEKIKKKKKKEKEEQRNKEGKLKGNLYDDA